jgi:hypothetical protein
MLIRLRASPLRESCGARAKENKSDISTPVTESHGEVLAF